MIDLYLSALVSNININALVDDLTCSTNYAKRSLPELVALMFGLIYSGGNTPYFSPGAGSLNLKVILS